MIYVAGPYMHANPEVRKWRYKAHRKATINLSKLEPDKAFFSPIVHGHNMLPELSHWTQEQWMKWCLAILPKCDDMYILKLPLWGDSKGLQKELETWATLKLITPIYIEASMFLTKVKIEHFWRILDGKA